MSRYIVKATNLEMPKCLIIWDRGSRIVFWGKKSATINVSILTQYGIPKVKYSSYRRHRKAM
jgi:hypothetical protein